MAITPVHSGHNLATVDRHCKHFEISKETSQIQTKLNIKLETRPPVELNVKNAVM
jgi:hypothetical protein